MGETLLEDDLFATVNIRGRSSGLPMNMGIGRRGKAQHAARIKVQMDHSRDFNIDNPAMVSVEEDPPEVKEGTLSVDLASVRRFIALNKPAIIDHWYERIDGVELSQALKRLYRAMALKGKGPELRQETLRSVPFIVFFRSCWIIGKRPYQRFPTHDHLV